MPHPTPARRVSTELANVSGHTVAELREDVTPVPVVLAQGALPVKAVEPIPVVERRPHFMPTGARQLVNGAPAVPILPDLPQRLRAIIKNPSGGATVWIGQTQNEASPSAGFPIAAGESLVLNHTGAVWAQLDVSAGVPQLVYVLAEQIDG